MPKLDFKIVRIKPALASSGQNAQFTSAPQIKTINKK